MNEESNQTQNETPTESQQLETVAEETSPSTEKPKKKKSSLKCSYAAIWLVCIGLFLGVFLGNFCRTASIENEINYLIESASSTSKYSYSKIKDGPKKDFNYSIMFATWGSFATVAVGFGLTSVHFRNQEKEIELLENLTNKN